MNAQLRADFTQLSCDDAERAPLYVHSQDTRLEETAMPANDATKTPVPAAITTPSSVKAGIGTLEFTDGYPTAETAAKLRDHLDYLHGVETFMNTIQGVSVYAIRKGFQDAGDHGRRRADLLRADGLPVAVPDRERRHRLLLVLSRPVAGPAGVRDTRPTPWASSTTCGSAGSATSACPVRTAARAAPTCWSAPSYDGPLPEGGCYVRHSRTNHVHLDRPGVHQREPGHGPRPDRRPDQGAAEDLPLRRRWRGQQHRRLPDRARARSASRPARRAPGSWRGPGWR